jgi:hypothetical protein
MTNSGGRYRSILERPTLSGGAWGAVKSRAIRSRHQAIPSYAPTQFVVSIQAEVYPKNSS